MGLKVNEIIGKGILLTWNGEFGIFVWCNHCCSIGIREFCFDDVGHLMWTHGDGFGCVVMLLWTGRKVLVVVTVVVVVLLVVLQTG